MVKDVGKWKETGSPFVNVLLKELESSTRAVGIGCLQGSKEARKQRSKAEQAVICKQARKHATDLKVHAFEGSRDIDALRSVLADQVRDKDAAMGANLSKAHVTHQHEHVTQVTPCSLCRRCRAANEGCHRLRGTCQ